MKAIIFGAFGQDGFYLSNLLISKGFKIIQIGRVKEQNDVDISNFNSVSELIRSTKADYIFHLAANSTTRHDALFENHKIICDGTLNILESVRIFSPHSKVFISGSGLQFINSGLPIKESDSFEARDPYSISRIQSVYAARYFRNLNIKVYVGYFFNHDSPRRTERHIPKKITEAVRRIAIGSNEILEIGDINVIKEWTFAGDIVEGIWEFMQQDLFFEANISSGKGYSIENWLEICFNSINKEWNQYVSINKDFKPDYKCLISDSSIISSTGWDPKTTFKDLALMMLKEIY
jgi:GDPmannose 4,6-dehydratase